LATTDRDADGARADESEAQAASTERIDPIRIIMVNGMFSCFAIVECVVAFTLEATSALEKTAGVAGSDETEAQATGLRSTCTCTCRGGVFRLMEKENNRIRTSG